MNISVDDFDSSMSTVKIGSDSDKSENFEELSGPDTDANSTDSNEHKLNNDYFDNNLPETVTLLKNPNTGAKVYLVGTAHFSKESQDDVSLVIQAVKPHVIILELCSARTSILSHDEETILEEAKNIDYDKIVATIKANGVYNGIMYLLLLNMSAHLTKEIGMAPGGEFRVAYKEAKHLGNCDVHLGDRPIQITLKRALGRLSWFQTIKLGWHLLTSKEPISKEEIEKCKRRDMLEQLLAEMAGEYPALGEVFVAERDIYLTHSLQAAASSKPVSAVDLEPLRVVGVVGIGHVVGISKLWPIDQRPYLADILIVPPPSLSSKIFRITFRLSLLSLGGYLVYRYVPVPKIVKETSTSFIEKLVSNFKSR